MADEGTTPDMLEQIRSLADQLRWAAQQRPPSIGTHSEILFSGMGGSAITGDYLGVVASPHGSRVVVNRGYGPVPLWAIRQRPFVMAASYSGNTEETLDFVLAAHESGLPVATIATGGELAELSSRHGWPSIEVPGGLQPRAAIGYMLGAAIKLSEAAHSVDDQRLSLVEAADFAEQEVKEGSDRWLEAAEISAALDGRVPIIYGGGPLSGVVARRWKTQINENAKRPAWHSTLPELDHNEIVGWGTMADLTRGRFGIVALSDPTDHDRIAPRLAHTRDLTQDAIPWVGRVHSSGTSTLTRLISLTLVGDLMSWMLANQAGVDPVAVTTIETLKKRLAEEPE